MENNENPNAPFDLTQLPTGQAMVRAFAINAAAMAAPIAVLGAVVAASVGWDKIAAKRQARRDRKSAPTAE